MLRRTSSGERWVRPWEPFPPPHLLQLALVKSAARGPQAPPCCLAGAVRLTAGRPLSTAQLAIALRKAPYQANLLLGGYDEKDGAELYFMDYLASLQVCFYLQPHSTMDPVFRHSSLVLSGRPCPRRARPHTATLTSPSCDGNLIVGATSSTCTSAHADSRARVCVCVCVPRRRK
jgi:hypothetical protein